MHPARRTALTELRDSQHRNSQAWAIVDDLIEQGGAGGFFKKRTNGSYRPSAARFATLNLKPNFSIKYDGKTHVLSTRGHTHAWKVLESKSSPSLLVRIWTRLKKALMMQVASSRPLR
jgi:hypothetical protein